MEEKEKSNLQTRKAELSDIDAIQKLVNSAYRGETSKKGWTTEADLLDGQRVDAAGLESTILEKDTVILLAFQTNHQTQQDSLIGTVLIQRQPSAAYIGMLTINPDLQSAGLGKQLLAAAENFATTHWNLHQAEMTVIQKRGELIKWYQKQGYADTGERRPFPYDDERAGRPKVADLEFIVMQKKI